MTSFERPSSAGSGKIASIEILRGIAACLVVFSHAARHTDRVGAAPGLITLFQPGHAGVDLFFTLSGFIILYVHRADIGQPGRLGHYATRRFSRVMPLYWIALFITLCLNVAGHRAVPATGDVLWWAALLPTTTEPLFAISWTLQYEAMFYVCFGLLIIDRRLGLLAFSAWMIVIAAFMDTAWPPALCRVFGLEFLFGLAAAEILHRVRIERPILVASLGAACFTIAYTLEACGLMGGFGVVARFAYGIPAAVMITGVAAAERAGRLTMPRWLEPIGRASYSIYLFQFIAIGTVWQALLATGLAGELNAPMLFAVLVAAALAGGLVANHWVERPLLRVFRRKRPLKLSAGVALGH